MGFILIVLMSGASFPRTAIVCGEMMMSWRSFISLISLQRMVMQSSLFFSSMNTSNSSIARRGAMDCAARARTIQRVVKDLSPPDSSLTLPALLLDTCLIFSLGAPSCSSPGFLFLILWVVGGSSFGILPVVSTTGRRMAGELSAGLWSNSRSPVYHLALSIFRNSKATCADTCLRRFLYPFNRSFFALWNVLIIDCNSVCCFSRLVLRMVSSLYLLSTLCASFLHEFCLVSSIFFSLLCSLRMSSDGLSSSGRGAISVAAAVITSSSPYSACSFSLVSLSLAVFSPIFLFWTTSFALQWFFFSLISWYSIIHLLTSASSCDTSRSMA
mmetsp:Transcript_14710/g.36838  ORF Transcript_14710/g.36838 Transcript_14710/m.36838 type:complete len:328 (-) Transcript_14710:1024-2007(-)